MTEATSGRPRLPGQPTRRSWIAGLLGTGFLGPDQDDFAREIADLRASLKKIGPAKLRLVVSENYLAIGNGTEAFLRTELRDCELVAVAYLDHFRARGFDVRTPATRMSVVALANYQNFSAYLDHMLPGGVAALYDRKTNRLVVYLGNTPQQDRGNLTHEATHQLTFNTGLLARDGDIPRCVVEGFGCYGECRNVDRRPDPGQRNFVHLDTLRQRSRSRASWIPLVDLISSDVLLIPGTQAGDVELAYAQSWLLVHYLMNDRARLPQFRSYLAAIKDRRTPARRLADARQHLGDLAELDGGLKRYRDRWLSA